MHALPSSGILAVKEGRAIDTAAVLDPGERVADKVRTTAAPQGGHPLDPRPQRRTATRRYRALQPRCEVRRTALYRHVPGSVADEPETEGRSLAATLRHRSESVQSTPLNRLERKGGKTVNVCQQVRHLAGIENCVAVRVDELPDGKEVVIRWKEPVEVAGGVEGASRWIWEPANLPAVFALDDHDNPHTTESRVSSGSGAAGLGHHARAGSKPLRRWAHPKINQCLCPSSSCRQCSAFVPSGPVHQSALLVWHSWTCPGKSSSFVAARTPPAPVSTRISSTRARRARGFRRRFMSENYDSR